MEALIEHLQSQGEDEQALAATLKDYNSRFYDEKQKDIQSGINVSSAAANYANDQGYGSVQKLARYLATGVGCTRFPASAGGLPVRQREVWL